MAKKPAARRSDWITATPTTPIATPRIVAAVSVTRWAPAHLAADKEPEQTPGEFGGTLAVGDEHGGNCERKDKR